MKTLFLTLTILSIASQVPHAWWSIQRYNRIQIPWMANLQNAVFCVIISVGIMAFVMIEKHYYALVGAIVEIIINMYYYNNQFRNTQDAFKKHWLAYFMAILIPMTIFVFAYTYSQL